MTVISVEYPRRGEYDSRMSLTTFKIGRKEFVVLPRRRYEQLMRAEQDQKDVEIVQKAREAYLSGKMKMITHEELKRKLGL